MCIGPFIRGKGLGVAESIIARDRFAIPNHCSRQPIPASSRSPRGHKIRCAGVAGVRRWDDGVALSVAYPSEAITTGVDDCLAHTLQQLRFVCAPCDRSVANAPHPPHTIDPLEFLLGRGPAPQPLRSASHRLAGDRPCAPVPSFQALLSRVAALPHRSVVAEPTS